MKGSIVITGASRGIGAVTAIKAAEAGYEVCVNYHSNRAAADSVVAAIEAKGGKAIAVQGDVAVEADILRMFETVDSQLAPLSALVNNAGILETHDRVENITFDRLQRVMTTNITGSFLCAREAVRRLSTAHGGQGGGIVNISSAASRLGSPNEYVDYAASKGAIDSFTIGLAKEVATEGIRVNAVRPGVVYTEIHALGGEPGRVDRVKDAVPMQRGGQPEEIANTVLWLLSDQASYITGSLLDVSGGR
ncbi:SDR family oxidoreductase [Sneathiella chinensis]|uniref:Short-chain dehydrogenase n=1 Tax=Sneathiella chinensis TaxID=349750 RepID=A0ABQ5U4X4_9PROT|nr:SDR family oxidoreductase [Sneathiella chinensis]GLQ06456.1 short-chain dehydrogenase [Sneathiella chinensis]